MLFKEERRQKITSMIDEIVEGKKKKICRLNVNKNQTTLASTVTSTIASGVESEELPGKDTVQVELPNSDIQINTNTVLTEEFQKIDSMDIPKDSTLVQLFTGELQINF